MMWHPLDANMIAADAHYAEPSRKEDFDECARCGCEFVEIDECSSNQSDRDHSLCVICEDEIA